MLSDQLAARIIDANQTSERVLVGIDGPDAAGKTTLAEHLISACRAQAPHAAVLRALLRPELRELWTFAIHLRISPAER